MGKKISSAKRSISLQQVCMGLVVIGFLIGFYRDAKRLPCPCICCKIRILRPFGRVYNYGKLFFIYLLKRPGCLFKKTVLGIGAFLTYIMGLIVKYALRPVILIFQKLHMVLCFVFEAIPIIFLLPLYILKAIFSPLSWAIKVTAPDPDFACENITYWKESLMCVSKKTHFIFTYPFSAITTVAGDIDWAIEYIRERYRKPEEPEEPPKPTPTPVPPTYCAPEGFFDNLLQKLAEISEQTSVLSDVVPATNM